MYKGGEPHGENNSKKTYRLCHCVLCAVFKPKTKWSNPLYRDCSGRDLFLSHERSSVHVQAQNAVSAETARQIVRDHSSVAGLEQQVGAKRDRIDVI